jgi:hypothetical protein
VEFDIFISNCRNKEYDDASPAVNDDDDDDEVLLFLFMSIK